MTDEIKKAPTMHVYRGWKSTKLHLALITQGLISGMYVGAGCPKELFGTFCMWLLAATGIFSGADLAQRFMAPKT